MKTIAVLIFLLCASQPLFADRDEGMTPADGFFLSQGSPEAGREAFVRLKCAACHWVQNETEFGNPVTRRTGPMLGWQQARYAPGWLANSFVSPSHTISMHSSEEMKDDELSRMPDFKEIMTVREMMDIVAYLRSLDTEDVIIEEKNIQGGAL